MNALDAGTAWAAEEPAPLLREPPAGEAYPLRALGPLQAAAEAIHDMTQAPPAIGAQSVLSLASLAAQGLADVETLHGRAPCSLFALTIAQSGERKSAADRLAMRGVRDFEAELADDYRLEADAHRRRLDIWEARRRAILAGVKSEPDIARGELAELGPPPEPPLKPSVVTGDPTLEGIVKNMDTLRPALGLFSDEGGAFIGGHALKSENRLASVSGLSKLWDGDPISRWRAGDGVNVHRGRRLACHLMAQPVAAAGLLADPIANGQGLLARFLMCEPPSAIGTRLRDGHASSSEHAVDAFGQRIRVMLRAPLPLREGSRNELAPPLLALEPEARDVLRDFGREVELAQAEGGALREVRPFASKAAEHAARIAGVLTLFETAAVAGVATVAADTMANAVALAWFYLSEARRLANAATISQETSEAERMRRWLVENWAEPFISASDAAQFGPFRETATARRILRFLEGFGHVMAVNGGAEVRGKRRREAWRVVL